METLIKIACYTDQPKYLEPIPRGLEYLRKSLLPDGRVALLRIPLQQAALHGRRVSADIRRLRGADSLWLEAIRSARSDRADVPRPSRRAAATPRTAQLQAEVRRIITELDAQGRWITAYSGERLVGQPKFRPGFRHISSQVFSSNVESLSEFILITGVSQTGQGGSSFWPWPGFDWKRFVPDPKAAIGSPARSVPPVDPAHPSVPDRAATSGAPASSSVHCAASPGGTNDQMVMTREVAQNAFYRV